MYTLKSTIKMHIRLIYTNLSLITSFEALVLMVFSIGLLDPPEEVNRP